MIRKHSTDGIGLASFLATFLVSIPCFAGPAVDLAARGEELMQNGNYARAAEVNAEFLKTYPTGGDGGPDLVFKVRYNLAWCYYLTEQYPQAIEAFSRLATDKVPSEDLKAQAMQLVGDCYSRYAGTLQDAKAKKENYNKAADTYTKFLSLFPKHDSVADVLYGRGLAYFRLEKYEESAKDLQRLLRDFPLNELKLDTEYLLATVLGTYGTVLRKDGKADLATKYLEAARDLFKRIIASNDIALANDAAYAAGEIFIQLKEYETAISYYRAVRSRDEVIASQQAKVERYSRAYAEALRTRDHRVNQIANLRMKELSKLKEINRSPDLLLAANMRVGDCYFQQKKYPEARVMYQFLLPYAELGDKEIAKQAAAQIVATYIADFRPEDAKAALEAFEEGYGVDPLAESFGLALGDLFLRKGKFEQALEQLEKALNDFPESELKPMMQFRKAQALDALGRAEDATALMKEVIAKTDIEKEAGAEVLYALGKALKNKGEFDEALKRLNTVASKYPEFELIDDVHYQIALTYRGKGETEKAIELLQKFTKDFAGKSQLIVPAMYQIGQCYEDKDDVDNAVKVYRELASKFPKDRLAPYAQYQVAIVYYNRERWEEMVKAFEELIQKFPKDPLVCDAHFWIGFKFQRERAYEKGVSKFETVVKECHDNPLAADAQYRIGNSWQSAAFAMGNYKAQDADKQPIWRDLVGKAIAAYENYLAEFPNGAQLDNVLDGLTQLTLAKINAEVETVKNTDAYFTKLSGQYAADPLLSARILLCLGSIYFNLNQTEQAIQVFAKAFQGAGDAKLPAAYYDQYGQLLAGAAKFDEAIGVYLQMEQQYEDDPQTQANAVWGLGNAYLQVGSAFWDGNEKDKALEVFDKAKSQFERLMKDYPWHKHAADAQFGIGNIAERKGGCDEAIKIYEQVAVKLKGDARIRSLLGLGRCLFKVGEYQKAADNFVKVALFYEGFPEFASEALWWAGQCYEKLNRNDKAVQQYRELIQKYSNAKFVEEATKRLGQLGGAK